MVFQWECEIKNNILKSNLIQLPQYNSTRVAEPSTDILDPRTVIPETSSSL
jgi:hypothetical protein